MKKIKLTWLGHSCFIVEKDGFELLFDPYSDGSVPGYDPLRAEADMVLCSHGHKDHNGVEIVTLKEGGENPFQITEISTYHDDTKGSQRGETIIHILDSEGMRLVHFGDIGCELTEEQRAAIGSPDVILIPVGGYYTIDAAQAKAIVDALKPRVVIPMHYRSGALGYPVLGTVDAFLDLCPAGETIICTGNCIEVDEDTKRQIAVLKAPGEL